MRTLHQSVIVAFLMFSLYILCASVQPVQAKLYKWKDDKGATHYTDNENNIPTKYRTKEKLEKLKGLTKPKPPKSESQENLEEETGEEDTISELEGVEENSEENENVIFLKEVKSFLEEKNAKTKKLLKSVPADVKNGKYYILPLISSANNKFAMATRIKESGIKALKPVYQYLISSASIDQEGRLGGDGYLAKIIETKNRLEREVVLKEGLIKKIDAEIAKYK